MAKIFKVSGYIVDVNGDSNVDEVIAEVSPGFDGMINQHIHVEEADIGKWNDESPLNYDKRCSEESREDERKMATTKGKTVPMRIDTCVRPVYIVEDMIRLGTVAILK